MAINMKVLLVEDEHRISQSIKKGLEQENFLVETAFDGETAFDLAESNEYEVIVLDLMIPKMDGMTICQKLREEDIHTPILVLTAKGDVEDKVAALNFGADDYLVKPFAFAELLARVKALTRRPKLQQSFVMEVEDLELDANTFEVKRAGKTIDLSRKEFAFLEYLMRHKNRILSKEQIMSNVWDYDANILFNTVEVYIGYLRNKIDKPFKDKKPLIHTVRGFGYKIGD